MALVLEGCGGQDTLNPGLAWQDVAGKVGLGMHKCGKCDMAWWWEHIAW